MFYTQGTLEKRASGRLSGTGGPGFGPESFIKMLTVRPGALRGAFLQVPENNPAVMSQFVQPVSFSHWRQALITLFLDSAVFTDSFLGEWHCLPLRRHQLLNLHAFNHPWNKTRKETMD